MSKVYYGLSGSDANETQVKMVWYYNNILRPAEEEEDHLPLARLSRLHGHLRLADRHELLSRPRSTCRSTGILHTGRRIITGAREPGETEEDFSPGARRSSRR